MTDMRMERQAQRGAGRGQGAVLLGIGTASPESIEQRTAAVLAEEFAGLSGGGVERADSPATEAKKAWLRRVFARSGVAQRGSVLLGGADGAGDATYERVRAFYGRAEEIGPRGPSTAVRMARYAEEAPPLAERAARSALAESGVEAGAITHLLTVTCTGFFAPGLDVELITRLGLRPDVQRTHIGFMGCHAAFNALAAARNIVRASQASGSEGAAEEVRVLLVCVELCTLHFAYGFDPEKLVANALFADGAAACVVGGDGGARDVGGGPGEGSGAGSGGGRWRLRETASLLLGGSREAMTWKIGDFGFEMTLSATLPALIGERVGAWCRGWLQGAGLEVGEVERWAIHPGGPRILTAVRDALGLAAEDLGASEEILRSHGNMSSATVLFVLKRLLQEGQRGDRCVAIGFGPGLMAEGMLLERIGG